MGQNTITNKKFFQFWIFLFPIASYYFYRYVGINEQVSKAIYFLVFPITLIMAYEKLVSNSQNFLYTKPLKKLLLLMFFSTIMAFVFRGQSFMESYTVTSVYLAIIYFFLLLKIKPDLEYIEKVIWVLCIVYIILWLYGLYMAPIHVFGIEREGGIEDTRGIFRLSIPGKGIVILSFFLAITKFVETKEKKWIIIFSLLYMVIIMHVIRQIILWSAIVGLIYLFRKSKWIWLVAILFSFVFFFVNPKLGGNSVLGNLLSETTDQYSSQKSGDENIRITEYKYYFTEYSENIFQVIFGNGVAHSASSFGKMESSLAENKYLYASDVGYAEIYIRFGIIGLLLYGTIFYRSIKQKVLPKYMYAKLFIIYLMFANIAASWVFHDTIIICLSLYILEYGEANKRLRKKTIVRA